MPYIGCPIDTTEGIDFRFLDYIDENNLNYVQDVLLGIQKISEESKDIKKHTWYKTKELIKIELYY